MEGLADFVFQQIRPVDANSHANAVLLRSAGPAQLLKANYCTQSNALCSASSSIYKLQEYVGFTL